MNQTKTFAMLMLFALFLQACGSQETAGIREYVKFLSNQDIPAERHYFLFIPESGCHGCVDYAIELDLRHQYADCVTIIYLLSKGFLTIPDSSNSNVYVSDVMTAYNYDINAFDVMIIETYNHQFVRTYETTSKNIAAIFNKTVLRPQ